MVRGILANGEIYHVYSKSIAGYKIFSNEKDYERIRKVIQYYQYDGLKTKFSDRSFDSSNLLNKNKIVQIIAYCFMPTHIHLTLKQLSDGGITIFMRKALNSYTHYFNKKYNRKGPLWEGRFKSLLIVSDEQLLHLTRYIHLNPVTAYLVNKSEDWAPSSYKEYLNELDDSNKICCFREALDIGSPRDYKKFVENNIEYQRELSKIKSLTTD